jgi:hypothetical protein
MRIAKYNILKGGSQRIHWLKMIEEHSVDLLLVQESYAPDEHLPPHLYPDARSQSVWARVEENRNGWGSAVFSKGGTLKPVQVSGFSGWVVGAAITGASWQAGLCDSLVAFSVHAPSRGESYWRQVNKLLDAIRQIAGRREILVGGDFNLTVTGTGPRGP